jgi:hypothetical protein
MAVILVVVVLVLKFNRPNVTGAHSSLPQLITPGTHGIVPCTNRLTGRKQGKMPIPRRAVIGEGV